VDGQKVVTLRGDNIANEFKQIVNDYVARNYARREPGRPHPEAIPIQVIN
jgi:(E)-4-hydroxy-3-methylbut-2-enyl-diphosphate synthase